MAERRASIDAINSAAVGTPTVVTDNKINKRTLFDFVREQTDVSFSDLINSVVNDSYDEQMLSWLSSADVGEGGQGG